MGKQTDQGFILLWNSQKTAKDKPQKVFRGHHFFVLCLAVTPDGKTIVSGGDEGSVLLHDVPSGKVRHVLWGREGKGNGYWNREINEVAVSPDGSLLAACDVRGFIKLWRL
jgi:WD40 repeat protein